MTTNKPALIHFPFYCNQYLGIMSELTAKERGFWITLLATFVVSDGIFPANGRLYKRCDAIDESDKKIVDSLLPEITTIGSEIISKQKALSKKRSKAGRIGGKANAKQVLTKDKAKVEAKDKHTETETETELDKEKEPNNIKKKVIKKNFNPDKLSKPIMMTQEQYDNLVTLHGIEKIEAMMASLAGYAQYARYKDHYSTIQSWIRRDEGKKTDTSKMTPMQAASTREKKNFGW